MYASAEIFGEVIAKFTEVFLFVARSLSYGLDNNIDFNRGSGSSFYYLEAFQILVDHLAEIKRRTAAAVILFIPYLPVAKATGYKKIGFCNFISIA